MRSQTPRTIWTSCSTRKSHAPIVSQSVHQVTQFLSAAIVQTGCRLIETGLQAMWRRSGDVDQATLCIRKSLGVLSRHEAKPNSLTATTASRGESGLTGRNKVGDESPYVSTIRGGTEVIGHREVFEKFQRLERSGETLATA